MDAIIKYGRYVIVWIWCWNNLGIHFRWLGNYVNNLIPAIQSRCTRFKFKKIPFEDAW